MEASASEALVVVELVEKYGQPFVVGLVNEAAEYLLSQRNGFIVA